MKKKKESLPKTVGSALKNIREKHGYSTDELALLIGNTAETIDLWENDRCEPTISECLILSRLYATPLGEMFERITVTPSVSDTTDYERVVAMNRMAKKWYA